MTKKTPERVFSSFFIGGFECTYASIEHRRVDLLKDTKHDVLCQQDYRLLKTCNITTVREGLAWSQIDKGKGKYDFSRFEPMMQAAQKEGIQQIWDLNHFDYPEYLDAFSEEFITAFARYAKAAIKVIRKYQEGTIFIVPINEISFWSHMGGSIGVWAPYAITRGFVFKQQLVKASIAAMDAIWSVDKNVRFMQVDPIFHRTPKKPVTVVKQAVADSFREIKFQAFDMLSGKMMPKLGGHQRYLDLLGCNYYPYNQEWISGDDPLDDSCHELIAWHSKHRLSLADMYQEVYDRYQRPLILSETGAWGDLRSAWWKRTLKETKDAIDRGLPVLGVCAYPIIDRPDWDTGHLTNSGWWDFQANDALCQRHAHQPTLDVVAPYLKKWDPRPRVRTLTVAPLRTIQSVRL